VGELGLAEDLDITKAAMMAKESAEGGVTPDEFAMMLAAAHYLYKDDDVIKIMKNDPELKPLLIALSHLIRTSRINSEKVIREMKLRWKRACRLKLLVLGDSSDVKSMAVFDALVNFGYSVIEDARGGWRGRLVTERIRTYKVEEGERKRKKRFGIF
jgi:hypothetical protein